MVNLNPDNFIRLGTQSGLKISTQVKGIIKREQISSALQSVFDKFDNNMDKILSGAEIQAFKDGLAKMAGQDRILQQEEAERYAAQLSQNAKAEDRVNSEQLKKFASELETVSVNTQSNSELHSMNFDVRDSNAVLQKYNELMENPNYTKETDDRGVTTITDQNGKEIAKISDGKMYFIKPNSNGDSAYVFNTHNGAYLGAEENGTTTWEDGSRSVRERSKDGQLITETRYDKSGNIIFASMYNTETKTTKIIKTGDDGRTYESLIDENGNGKCESYINSQERTPEYSIVTTKNADGSIRYQDHVYPDGRVERINVSVYVETYAEAIEIQDGAVVEMQKDLANAINIIDVYDANKGVFGAATDVLMDGVGGNTVAEERAVFNDLKTKMANLEGLPPEEFQAKFKEQFGHEPDYAAMAALTEHQNIISETMSIEGEIKSLSQIRTAMLSGAWNLPETPPAEGDIIANTSIEQFNANVDMMMGELFGTDEQGRAKAQAFLKEFQPINTQAKAKALNTEITQLYNNKVSSLESQRADLLKGQSLDYYQNVLKQEYGEVFGKNYSGVAESYVNMCETSNAMLEIAVSTACGGMAGAGAKFAVGKLASMGVGSATRSIATSVGSRLATATRSAAARVPGGTRALNAAGTAASNTGRAIGNMASRSYNVLPQRIKDGLTAQNIVAEVVSEGTENLVALEFSGQHDLGQVGVDTLSSLGGDSLASFVPKGKGKWQIATVPAKFVVKTETATAISNSLNGNDNSNNGLSFTDAAGNKFVEYTTDAGEKGVIAFTKSGAKYLLKNAELSDVRRSFA